MRWRRRRGPGYVALVDDDEERKAREWWGAVFVGVGSIASLYVPVSDLNVLGELPARAGARQGLGTLEEEEEGLLLDDL